MSATTDPDCFPGAPHPRERHDLLGHLDAERELLAAYRSGRMHHAWILGGLEGIGKATLAYRLARFVLAHPDPTDPAVAAAFDLSVPADHPTARKIAARGHPDLMTLAREINPDTGRPRTVIQIDQVRRALALFGSTSGAGGWRVCVVDSADDLNAASANALLKVVEEPPPRSLFLVVSHMPGRLLPTIRSRCRMRHLRPLAEGDVAAIVAGIEPGTDPERLARAVSGAEGSPRRALELLDEAIDDIVGRTKRLIGGLPYVDLAQLQKLADTIGPYRAGTEEPFLAFVETIEAHLSAELAARADRESPARLAPIAELWNKTQRAVRELDAYNLDRRPFVFGLFDDLARIARR